MFPDQEIMHCLPSAVFVEWSIAWDSREDTQNLSIFLRNINQLGFGIRRRQTSAACFRRVPHEHGDFKVVATNITVGIDVAAMEEEIKAKVLLAAKFCVTKESPKSAATDSGLTLNNIGS